MQLSAAYINIALAVFLALCAGLALYIRLTISSSLTAFLEKLDTLFVKKEVDAAVKEAERHAAAIEALRVSTLERSIEQRLIALEHALIPGPLAARAN